MPYVASITAYLCKDAIRGQYYRVSVLGCHTWPVLPRICVRMHYVASITVYLCKDAFYGGFLRSVVHHKQIRAQKAAVLLLTRTYVT